MLLQPLPVSLLVPTDLLAGAADPPGDLALRRALVALLKDRAAEDRIGSPADLPGCLLRVFLGLLSSGLDVAVITDAGTPGISDPGMRLVAAVVEAGHQVTAVPGPAALVMALVLSGFDTTRFVFEGFIPRSGRERTDRLTDIASERRTVVLYEAPHRMERTIADLAAACGGERHIAMARELTKLHEEVWRGSLRDAGQRLAEVPPRGEYVLVLHRNAYRAVGINALKKLMVAAQGRELLGTRRDTNYMQMYGNRNF